MWQLATFRKAINTVFSVEVLMSIALVALMLVVSNTSVLANVTATKTISSTGVISENEFTWFDGFENGDNWLLACTRNSVSHPNATKGLNSDHIHSGEYSLRATTGPVAWWSGCAIVYYEFDFLPESRKIEWELYWYAESGVGQVEFELNTVDGNEYGNGYWVSAHIVYSFTKEKWFYFKTDVDIVEVPNGSQTLSQDTWHYLKMEADMYLPEDGFNITSNGKKMTTGEFLHMDYSSHTNHFIIGSIVISGLDDERSLFLDDVTLKVRKS